MLTDEAPLPKLRTVVWDFAGEPVPGDVRTAASPGGEADAVAEL